ncbi:hypothetical protein Q428_05865 [Fervidicella metallireducens AeB]|uniref:Flagellar hook-associated protein 1 n=1 Tax=Fervidicella metallireducens AeB TaxID=1403537 RepID=A0A017RVK9_9CLOT|nr:flagellar hook-associated protein FlgK [Fervidicella metallireducens]EYE88818.1 hypothetical protein Q428_05865 [Fervidicella metallireducens AeB]
MSGLFSTFNIVKRGMMAQQTALTVVSHNVANANTEGYSVQRVDLKTTQPFGMASRMSAAEPGQIGTGVEVASITRARDKFLDVQIRKETSTLNRYKTREEFLSSVESIFTEPSDTGLANTLTKFWDSWNALATNPESSTARTLVKSNGQALAETVTHNYRQLEDLENNVGDLIQQNTFDTASILTQIADLNQQIKAVVIGGKIPNDLYDRRDLLLDKLSEKFSIETEETEFGGIKIKSKIENGDPVEILTDGKVKKGVAYINNLTINVGGKDITKDDYPITLDNPLPNKFNIEVFVDGDINKKQTIEINGADNLKKYCHVEELSGGKFKILSIMPHTVFYEKQVSETPTLSEDLISPSKFDNGTFKGLESLYSEINDYKKQLNTLAKTIAISVNTVHSNSKDSNTGVNFFDKDAETSDQAAKYLKINEDIEKDVSKINAGKYLNSDKDNYAAGNGERALMLGQLRNTRMEILKISSREEFLKNVFKNADGTDINTANVSLTGTNLVKDVKLVSNNSGTTVDNYFKATIAQLGVSNQEAKKMITNQEALLDQLVVRRESISGVSLDEEMTNMIQFQRAYQANAKMINVIDELLDVVVNGLKR